MLRREDPATCGGREAKSAPVRPRFAVLVAFILGLMTFHDGARSVAVAQDPGSPADTVLVERRSPGGAFLRSLVLPGWGQAWVGAPVRGGVYFALEAASLWMLYRSTERLGNAREREAWLRDVGLRRTDDPLPLVRSREGQREDWLTLSVFLLLFSAADAYVAAHLQDFSEGVTVGPGPDGGLRIQANVPVGGNR